MLKLFTCLDVFVTTHCTALERYSRWWTELWLWSKWSRCVFRTPLTQPKANKGRSAACTLPLADKRTHPHRAASRAKGSCGIRVFLQKRHDFFFTKEGARPRLSKTRMELYRNRIQHLEGQLQPDCAFGPKHDDSSGCDRSQLCLSASQALLSNNSYVTKLSHTDLCFIKYWVALFKKFYLYGTLEKKNVLRPPGISNAPSIRQNPVNIP